MCVGQGMTASVLLWQNADSTSAANLLANIREYAGGVSKTLRVGFAFFGAIANPNL